MAQALFTNNAYSTLASGITDVATTLTVTASEGARFPSPTGADYFYATLIDTSNNLEIVKCTARSTDTFTVVRGQESTTAQAYSAGDRIELRFTAAGVSENVTAAATSATNAATSETNAATSETNAATSESNAATSETNAATSETNADADATATAADAVATAADAVATAADAVSTAADAAAASTSASNAATSETNAATSETNAAASYDSFDDRYLGAKSSAPTLDNDGNALLDGALYWDTTANDMYVYDLGNTTWVTVSNSTSSAAAATSASEAAASAAAAAASAAGFKWKPSVLNATTANITLSGEQTIDGVLTSTSRILVKTQTAPEENGIYVTAAGAWARATDMDAWDEVPSAAVVVEDGTIAADTVYICTSDTGGTLETTAITWVQIGAGDVVGPGSATDAAIALFDGTTGRLLQDSGYTITAAGAALLDDANAAAQRTTLDVPQKVATTVDNAVVRSTGTAGEQQESNVLIDDDDNMYNHGAKVNAQTGTTYTLVGTDNGKIVTLNNASAITLTIPQTSTETIAAGFQCAIIQRGAGQVTCVAEGSDTIESKGSLLSLTGQHSLATIVKITAGSPNTYGLYGDLA